MNYFKKIIQYYKTMAIVLLNVFILFLLINACLLVLFKIKDHYVTPITTKRLLSMVDRIKKICPELTKEEIKNILSETYAKPLLYEPFTQYKEQPHTGRYVNIDKNGFRLTKNQGPWPPASGNFNLFLFGGSTTFGYGVPDNQTIASYLQEFLARSLSPQNVRIYNFGRAHYYSTVELVFFERLLLKDYIPDMAIFIDGLNDFIPVETLPAYTNEFNQILAGESISTRRLLILTLRKLPITRGIKTVERKIMRSILHVKKILPGASRKADNKGKAADNTETEIKDIVDRYCRTKKLIEAVASVYGVKSVFVWQPVPTYKYDLKYHFFARQIANDNTRYGYPYMAEYIKGKPLGDNFFWCADMQEQIKEPLYVDKVHYSPRLNRDLAKAIYDLLLERNFIAEETPASTH